MITFFGEPQLKAQLLARLEAHRAADQFVQGQYWEEGKGCYIGCAIHGADSWEFERQYGLSIHVAKLGEYFFEGFPAIRAKDVPIEIIEAIPVGVESSVVWPRLLNWLVNDPTYGLLTLPLEQATVDIINRVHALYANWPQMDQKLIKSTARDLEDTSAPTSEWLALRVAVWAAEVPRTMWGVDAAPWALEAAQSAGGGKLDTQYAAFLHLLRGMSEVDAPQPEVAISGIDEVKINLTLESSFCKV